MAQAIPSKILVAVRSTVEGAGVVALLELSLNKGAFVPSQALAKVNNGSYLHKFDGNPERTTIVQAMGGQGMVLIEMPSTPAERNADWKALQRRTHPAAGDMDAHLVAGQRLALSARFKALAAWPRSHRIALGAALALSLAVLQHLFDSGRLPVEGLENSLRAIDRFCGGQSAVSWKIACPTIN